MERKWKGKWKAICQPGIALDGFFLLFYFFYIIIIIILYSRDSVKGTPEKSRNRKMETEDVLITINFLTTILRDPQRSFGAKKAAQAEINRLTQTFLKQSDSGSI